MTETSMQTECPSDDRLAALAAGRLSGEALDSLETHLDACPLCRQLLAAVSNGSTGALRPSDRPNLRPGDVVGRYQIERLIGAGGMGVLYVAVDPKLGRRVALKLMRPSLAAEGGRLRLLREAQAMAQLSHPSVVNVFDLGEVDGRVFVAMELLEGGTLRQWMKAPHTWPEVVEKFCQAGEGLAAAHAAGVVHRDFKPENVLMTRGDHPKVGDFGLASPGLVAAEELPPSSPLALRMTHAGSMLGTPAYMSPEQLAGQQADARSDQYGFCVSLYEALARQRPFPADTVEELRIRVAGGMPPPPRDGLVPAHVWAAIARGLNPDPAMRFPDLPALLTVLRCAPPPTRVRRSGPLLAAAAAGLLALAGVGWGLLATPRPATITVVRGPAPENPAPQPPAEDEPAPAPLPKASAVASREPLGESRTLTVALGETKVLAVPRVDRVAVGSAEVAEVSIEGTTLRITGLGRGRTTLLVWAAGQRTAYLVDVQEGLDPPQPLEPVGDHLTLAEGAPPSKPEVMGVMVEAKPVLHACAQVQRMNAPGVHGKVVLRWHLTPAGRVTGLKIESMDPQVPAFAACLMQVVQPLGFAPSSEGEDVSFPFRF